MTSCAFGALVTLLEPIVVMDQHCRLYLKKAVAGPTPTGTSSSTVL